MMIEPRNLSNIYENMHTVGELEGGGQPQGSPLAVGWREEGVWQVEVVCISAIVGTLAKRLAVAW